MTTRSSRLRALPALLLGAGALTAAGCLEDVDGELDGDLNGDGIVDCADLDGGFAADEVVITSTDDPELFEDFDGDVDLEVGFGSDGTFTSDLDDPDEGLISTGGDFVFDEDTITFSEALVPGLDADDATFACTFDGDALSLAGDVGFDFDDDGDFEPATFEGTLSPVL